MAQLQKNAAVLSLVRKKPVEARRHIFHELAFNEHRFEKDHTASGWNLSFTLLFTGSRSTEPITVGPGSADPITDKPAMIGADSRRFHQRC